RQCGGGAGRARRPIDCRRRPGHAGGTWAAAVPSQRSRMDDPLLRQQNDRGMSESRLFGFAWRRISAAMFARPLLTPLLLLTLTLPAAAHTAPAHPAPAAGPKSIGKFDDWTAATHLESGQTVCYAFVRAESSSP